MERLNIVIHTTTFCNYKCSYCNVIKSRKFLSTKVKKGFFIFVERNKDYIERIKFFWWEPLLRQEDIKDIIKHTYSFIGNKYEIVTNTSLINDSIGRLFSRYFETLFFSIDSENTFSYEKILDFIKYYDLKERLYFNIVISPWKEKEAFSQFENLYKLWFRKFNLLPVYFTKPWRKDNLLLLSNMLKQIVDFSLYNTDIDLFGFQKNTWYNTSLVDNAFFIDIDGKIYYSDIVATYIGRKYKDLLYLWDIKNFSFLWFKWIDLIKQKEIMKIIEEENYKNMKWQRELHKIMDYFSTYLNKKNEV